ncbi:MAG: FecR domain-containing protein, partial [Bryobacteraceae bacterium]
MNIQENTPEAILDREIAAIREEEPDAAIVAAAGDRIRKRISAESSADRGCGAFREMIPAWREGTLPEARRLLLEDHASECVSCWKNLHGTVRIVSGDAVSKDVVPRDAGRTRTAVARTAAGGAWRYWAAAAAAVCLGLFSYTLYDRFVAVPPGSRAIVQSLDGAVYLVAAGAPRPVRLGEELGESDVVRTAGGAHAFLKLRDGSLVELNERAELSVSARHSDTTVHLERGNIIIQAAKRRTGHLYVASGDCRVSVTGTTFSVNRGTKGSRVSVVEGEVRVAQNRRESVLHSGDQVSTHSSMASVPVRDEIAWSRNFDQHLALLREFAELKSKIETVQMPGLRYSSRLLPLLPGQTVFVASVPNLGPALNEAYLLLEQQLSGSTVLREWWEESELAKDERDLEETVQRLKMLGEYLGDEALFSVPLGGSGPHDDLLLIAEVRRPGLREFLEAELRKLAAGSSAAGSNQEKQFRIVDQAGLAAVSNLGEDEWLILLDGGLLAISGDLRQLREVASNSRTPGSGRFVTTGFYARLSQAYREGAGLLLGVDVESIAAQARETMKQSAPDANSLALLDQSGAGDARYLILEQKNVSGTDQYAASLSFSGQRQGVASWLGSPSPMATLDFVSAEASMAASVVAKSPALLLDELIGLLESSDPKIRQELARIESELGVNLREDIAATLGGEVTIALDGPMLPVPSWKLALEVHQPERFQQAIERLLAELKRQPDSEIPQDFELSKEVVDGRTFYALRVPQASLVPEIHYVYV